MQDGESGIKVSSYIGIGEKMSFGIVTSYLLSVSKVNVGQAPNFDDKIELRKLGTHSGFRHFCKEVFVVFYRHCNSDCKLKN
ncbi:DUF6646 family protein [Flavobacterium micromati]|uniref:DUF6646 family protein n=1 Tax=Flavobacterium micromati TaxID=229205 RepID=UPI0037C0FC07